MISNVTFFSYPAHLNSPLHHNACILSSNFITVGTSFPGLPYSKTSKYFDSLECYFYYTISWLVTLQSEFCL